MEHSSSRWPRTARRLIARATPLRSGEGRCRLNLMPPSSSGSSGVAPSGHCISGVMARGPRGRRSIISWPIWVRSSHSIGPKLSLVQGLDEFELLALGPLAVDEPPTGGASFGDRVGIRLRRGGTALGFRRHCDHAVGSHLRHAAQRRFRLQIADELVEVDIVPDVEADVHRPWIGWLAKAI